MAEIKVLALDLDGTLTNSQKEVTPRTRAALDAAIAKGVTIVLASGRPTAGVLPLAKELGLDKKGGCILSYNGGKIIDCRTGETLYQKQLDAQYVPELCAFAAAQNPPAPHTTSESKFSVPSFKSLNVRITDAAVYKISMTISPNKPPLKQHLILFVYSSFIKKPPQITC